MRRRKRYKTRRLAAEESDGASGLGKSGTRRVTLPALLDGLFVRRERQLLSFHVGTLTKSVHQGLVDGRG